MTLPERLLAYAAPMFGSRREVLRAKQGSLAQTPLPLLLHALQVEERTATLELKLRNLIKRVHFEAGVPVGCESNLLHETFGKYLVAKGKLSEAQHHQLLSESAAVDKPLQTLLMERQLLSGFELFKHLQANLAHTLLDAFRWADAQWRLGDLDELATPIKMNTAQLVFTGCAQLPVEMLAAHCTLDPLRPLALLEDPHEALKLSAKDLRLVQALKKRPTLEALLSLPGLAREDVQRRLYALCVLEFVDYAEVVDAQPRTRSSPSSITRMPVDAVPALEPAPSPPVAPPRAAADEVLMNALAAEFMSFRGKDPFDLLGITPLTPGTGLATAFLAKTDALAPQRFTHPDAKNRAELLLLAYARAYGALVEPEQHALHSRRREHQLASRKQGARDPKAAAEHFKIRTDLLDAKAQLETGRQKLDAGQLTSAIEHFEYAVDIEPTGRAMAYLALARFRQAPEFAAERSLQLLAEACARDPQCEEAWAFRADLALSLSRHAEAAEAFRNAARLNPKQERYQQAVRGLDARR